ncbi:hypothetical protein F4775DRAFT_569866 [Biscogniauxia sp. FL1348]|nr:hypothetical protein F4775DRAFT_569866 [Biscogniauxia sp. FL1348]
MRAKRPHAEGLNETSIDQVLRDAKGKDFTDQIVQNNFRNAHCARLLKKPELDSHQDEVLHAIAKETSLDEYRSFLVWCIKTFRQLLNIKAVGYTPLALAIMKGNNDFIQLVLDNVDEIYPLLGINNAYQKNALHLAIEYENPFCEIIIAKAQQGVPSQSTTTSVSSDVFTSKSSEPSDEIMEMTPLHLAVAIITENDTGRSVIDVPQPRSNIKTNTKSDSTASLDRSHPKPPERTKTLGRLTETPLGVKRHENNLPYFNSLNVVKQLIKAYDRVLVDIRDSNGHTPFQARLAELEKSEQKLNAEKGVNKTKDEDNREAFRHEMIENDKILCYLREYIITNFDRRDAIQALYKVGEERLIEFDLSGLSRSTIDSNYLTSLRKVLKFEGLLKYVALPRLTFGEDEEYNATEGRLGDVHNISKQVRLNKSDRGSGLQHMCPIFHWLRERHVKSILEVVVVDDAEPSHSDEAIEKCVQGFDVRTWNWYKVDLNCTVILNSAKRAKDVTLYASGNNAVLMGWSSPSGLVKLSELTTLRIYVKEGLERRQRIVNYMDEFKRELEGYKKKITFTWDFYKADTNYSSVFNGLGPPQHESRWMRAAEKFADFLARARPDVPVPPVKIAIIDDGINTSLSEFTDKIQGGDSFYRPGKLSRRQGAYFVPSGPHGTLMAQLICKLCPVVKLYIAQLEVLPGQFGQRSFTTESAEEAIQWAINRDVDIISMSWSINSSKPETRLENVLQTAAKERIIMFCASIDEGPTASDKTYPGKESSCIKIGASTLTGTKFSWVSESYHFLIPGEVPNSTTETDHWDRPHTGSFGSSVSTALAAGLAGSLIYCDRLLHIDNRGNGDGEPRLHQTNHCSKETDQLRQMGMLLGAFESMSRNKFVQIWDYLPSKLEDLQWNRKSYPDSIDDTKRRLEEFMNNRRKPIADE